MKNKTRILKLSNKAAVDVAVAILRSGGVVILPTESSYGIAVDATNAVAVAKVYLLKKRSGGKSMPVIVSSVAMAKKFFNLNKTALKFCKFFPAPLTLVVKQKRGKLARNISSDGTAAFRVPKSKFCRDVSQRLGRPITSTSANISGKQPVFSAVQVKRLFGGKVELIVDAGNLKKRKPSTIVSCTGEKPVVLRKGEFIFNA
ncbi:MAG: L-threonylcarbamoyladenylate synthase [Candidatus Micrarchaeota archaeon]|nr:L-threonylcarbamoyladenylate synthase [Candidatus Micrarchaeota archaeon]